MQSDRDIVTATLSGDRSAYRLLVRRYEKTAVAVAGRILDDFHSAEDATQEAFVTAHEKLASLRDPSRFGPWFLRIVRNRACTIARRGLKAEPLDPDRVDAWSGRNGRLDDSSKDLLETVNRLPEQERRVVMLKYFGGYKAGEIAEMSDRSSGTVRKQLTRAHTRLRKWLKED